MAAKKPTPAKRRTPTTLAPPGLQSVNGVSPSGFRLSDYVAEETYVTRGKLPTFLNVTPALENPCAICPGECCRARVVVTVSDLVRLAAPLQLHPTALCHLEETQTGNSEPILIGDTPKHMVLRKGDDDHCVLQLKVDGQRRCGVHAIRPAICRLYPFAYERGKTRVEMGLVACPTRWLLNLERRNAALDAFETFQHDRVLDRKLVRRWNKLPEEERTPPAWWRYAMVEGAAALGLDVSYLTREPPRRRLKPALW